MGFLCLRVVVVPVSDCGRYGVYSGIHSSTPIDDDGDGDDVLPLTSHLAPPGPRGSSSHGPQVRPPGCPPDRVREHREDDGDGC